MTPSDTDKDAALEALIRQTVKDMGAVDPSELPHRVRERLKGQAVNGDDLDARISAAMREIDRIKRK